MRGKDLEKSDKLKSCADRHGSTVQVTSRVRGGGKHKDKKNKEEKKRSASSVKLEQTGGEMTEVGPELNKGSQVSSITECVGKSQATSEEVQRVVEEVKSMRMVMAGARKHATSEGLQRMEKMDDGLKKLEKEARTRQEEVRAKGAQE